MRRDAHLWVAMRRFPNNVYSQAMRACRRIWALACTAALLSGCAAAATHAQVGGDPLTGQAFYVDPANVAAREAAALRASGDVSDAEAIQRIAAQPTATWITNGPEPRPTVESVTRRASAAGKSALLVAYYIPGRDCGGFSSGGAPTATAYRQWIARLAAGIGERTATVIVEPDAVLQAIDGCLSPTARRQRLALLAGAVAVLRRRPHVTAYLDAGNVGWLSHPRAVASALRSAGVGKASGFALNVANFYTTAATVAAGERLASLLGGAHFVIDTGRNGNGPLTGPEGRAQWCNPVGRALGPVPTTATGHARVDAYLWVKQPGTSDGQCRAGAPSAGVWWPSYALELAQGTPAH